MLVLCIKGENRLGWPSMNGTTKVRARHAGYEEGRTWGTGSRRAEVDGWIFKVIVGAVFSSWFARGLTGSQLRKDC